MDKSHQEASRPEHQYERQDGIWPCLLSHMQLDFMASVYTCEGSKSVERKEAYCLLAYFEAIN